MRIHVTKMDFSFLFGLCPWLLAHSSPNPCSFPGPLERLERGLVTLIRGLVDSPPHPTPPSWGWWPGEPAQKVEGGRNLCPHPTPILGLQQGRGWRAHDLVAPVTGLEASTQSRPDWVWGASWLAHRRCQSRAPGVGVDAPCASLPCLATRSLSCLFINWAFPQVRSVHLWQLRRMEGGGWGPEACSPLVWSLGNAGTRVGTRGGAGCGVGVSPGTEPRPVRSDTISGNSHTPIGVSELPGVVALPEWELGLGTLLEDRLHGLLG